MTTVNVKCEPSDSKFITMNQLKIGEYGLIVTKMWENTLVTRCYGDFFVNVGDSSQTWDLESAAYHNVERVAEVNISYKKV